MKLLLDTNALLRWLRGDILPKRLVTQIEKADVLAVSIVSPWELGLKASRHPAQKLITSDQLWHGMEQIGARILHVRREHIDLATSLPEHHYDPFDRMIIAQAIVENLAVVSSDERFPSYAPAGLRVLWQ